MKYVREILLVLLAWVLVALGVAGMVMTRQTNPLAFPPLVWNLMRLDIFVMFLIIASKWLWK